MASIKFTKAFGGRKKDDVWKNCPNHLAARLVNTRKVAKYTGAEKDLS